jgi:hypothetical protein
MRGHLWVLPSSYAPVTGLETAPFFFSSYDLGSNPSAPTSASYSMVPVSRSPIPTGWVSPALEGAGAYLFYLYAFSLPHPLISYPEPRQNPQRALGQGLLTGWSSPSPEPSQRPGIKLQWVVFGWASFYLKTPRNPLPIALSLRHVGSTWGGATGGGWDGERINPPMLR